MAEYYTTGQTDALLELRSSTSHTHAYYAFSGLTAIPTTIGGYGITDAYTTGQAAANFLSATTSYYNQAQTLSLITSVRTGATLLSELYDVILTSPLTSGQTLRWELGYWKNSAITYDLSPYYTIVQTNAKFYTSAQTDLYFSSTGHSHYLTGLTDVADVTPAHGQFLMFSAGTWLPVTSAIGGDYVVRSGDTMDGNLSFSFMTGFTISGSTGWEIYVDSTGKVVRGMDRVGNFITGLTLISFITGTESFWTGSTFIPTLTAYTLYHGQYYVDTDYFYEYLNGTLYRTYYSRKDHEHDGRYYTKTELLNTGVLDGRYIRSAVTYNLGGLGDVSITGATLSSNSFLKYNPDSSTGKWENYILDMSLYSRISNMVPTGRTIIGISGLTGGHDLNSNIFLMHLTGTPTSSPGTPSTNVLASITFDAYGHVIAYETSELYGLFQPLGSMALNDLSDVTILSPAYRNVLWYDTMSMTPVWNNHALVKTDISDFTDTDYVHRTNDESISGTKTFNGAITSNGGISFSATTNIIAPYLTVSDRYLYINTLRGNGLGNNGFASVNFQRGSYTQYTIYYDEGPSCLLTGGTLKIGFDYTGKTVATIDDFNHNAVCIWNQNYGHIYNSSAFTYDPYYNNMVVGDNYSIIPSVYDVLLFGSGNTALSTTLCFGRYNTGGAWHSIAQGEYNYIGSSFSGAFGSGHILTQMASYLGYSYAFGSGHTMLDGGVEDGQYCGAFGERNELSGNWSFATGKRNIIDTTAQFSAIVGGSGITATLMETLYTRNFSHTGGLLGFYNVAPTERPAALTISLPTLTGGTPSQSDGMGGSPYGWMDADAMNAAIGTIMNLQTRVNELESKMLILGLVDGPV